MEKIALTTFNKKFKPLKILLYPDSKLKQIANSVRPNVNLSEVQQLIELMFKTMKFFKGIGLASPQIGIGLKIITLDLQDQKTNPLVLINPEIIKLNGEQNSIESCLSFPQATGNIKRAEEIEVRFLDENGNKKILQASGLLSACLQHEIDHLNGVLFLDKMSRLKKEMILKRYKKIGRL